MCKTMHLTAAAVAVCIMAVIAFGAPERVRAHDAKYFSAGEPGNQWRPAKVIEVTMTEADGKMLFKPNKIEVRRGEQVRFVLKNEGAFEHKCILATRVENAEHAEVMKKFPEMEHDHPNGKRVKPNSKSEILWRFTESGEFEFACLIPGHYEAGMHGRVIVK